MKNSTLLRIIKEEIQNVIKEETYDGKTAISDMRKDAKYSTLSSTGKLDANKALQKGETVTLEEKKLDEMARAKVIYSLVPAEKASLEKVIDAAKGNTKLALQYLADKGELLIADLAKDLKKDPATFNNPAFRNLMTGLIEKGIIKPSSSFIEKAPKEKVTLPKTEKPKLTKSTPTGDEESNDLDQETPSDTDIAAGEKEYGDIGAEKLSSEENEKFEKLNKAIKAKVRKLEDMPAFKRSKSLDMSVLKQIIAKPEIKKLFSSKGIDIKDLVSSVIA